jgi:hypothetical protein
MVEPQPKYGWKGRMRMIGGVGCAWLQDIHIEAFESAFNQLYFLMKPYIMENYIFFHRNGSCYRQEADPVRPEIWPFLRNEIREVYLDCTELFLSCFGRSEAKTRNPLASA